MAETTGISWADATVNFWIGCTKVSAACDGCYAEAYARRVGGPGWGHGQPRRFTTGAAALAFRLQRKAVREGRRLRVFCNSLSDFFDAEVPNNPRDEAIAMMAATPGLDWLVLTKRPKVARDYILGLPERRRTLDCHAALDGEMPWPLPNVWLGVTAENQKMADLRVPDLLATPAAVRFVSAEPLLGPVDLTGALTGHRYQRIAKENAAGQDASGTYAVPCERLDWVICGGESGPGARPMHPSWARALRDQCAAARVPFFFKQWGAWAPARDHPEARRADVTVLPDGSVREWQTDFPEARLVHDRMVAMRRLGMRRAGRLLDGAIHDGRPAPNGTPAPDDDGAQQDAGGPTTAPRGGTPC